MPPNPSDFAKRAGRVALRPITERLDFIRRDLDLLFAASDRTAADVEQLRTEQKNLYMYIDRVREELVAEVGDLTGPARSVAEDISTVQASTENLARQLERLESLSRTVDDENRSTRNRLADVAGQIGDLRSTVRLSQAMFEQQRHGPPSQTENDERTPGDPSSPAPRPEAERHFQHPVPSFDLLYRAFEDRHRGSREEILDRIRGDYRDLLDTLPEGDEPVVDLGCGRGELVDFVSDAGFPAIGVDSNFGQLTDLDPSRFVQADLFDWLDERPDQSVRAVFSLHVIEHVPLDLQIRLVFEAHRVLVPGGVLVLETPNALSLATAATNFWVDPTHLRVVHPALMEQFASEAGFAETTLCPLHPIPLEFGGKDEAPALAADLQSLILGHGDMAVIARR